VFVKKKLPEQLDLPCYTVQGRTQGGWGYKPPMSLIFNKNFITCAKRINCFRILSAC